MLHRLSDKAIWGNLFRTPNDWFWEFKENNNLNEEIKNCKAKRKSSFYLSLISNECNFIFVEGIKLK